MKKRREIAETKIVRSIQQPMTCRQLAHRLGIRIAACSSAARKLESTGILKCMTPSRTSSRVYWLTKKGREEQRKVRLAHSLPDLEPRVPDIDWGTYGWCCFRHRTATIKAMSKPMQPAAVKREAKRQDPGLRMSANNTRDHIKRMAKRGIAQPVEIRGKAHLRYELTKAGRAIRDLLFKAETKEVDSWGVGE